MYYTLILSICQVFLSKKSLDIVFCCQTPRQNLHQRGISDKMLYVRLLLEKEQTGWCE